MQDFATSFSNFFFAKIDTIHVALHTQSTLTSTTFTDHHPTPGVSQLHSLPVATTSDIRNLLNKSPTTSCALGPLPTWLLKDVTDTFIHFLTRFVNSSITSSIVPHCLKHANVTPVLNKANRDHNNMNWYRSISNLPFVSKLIERYVTRCLIKHLTDNTLLERYQSAYKSHNYTETALVLVQNDIIEALDRRYGVILVLLDMSAAFDTVDHGILLSRLKQRFGMSGPALTWMRPYLSDKWQSVNVPGGAFIKSSVACSVTQGSVLGPLLFSMYTAPKGDIIRRHNLSFHLYADDTQLYIKF